MRPLTTRLRQSALFEIVSTIVIALCLAFAVQAYAVKPYRIPSGSMEPTLAVGQRVLVDRFTHRLGRDPAIGDVVVFRPPAGAESELCGDRSTGGESESPCARPVAGRASQTFIKRVVALGGDTIAVKDGHAIRNGRRANEPFARACGGGSGCDFPRAIRIPRGYVFLMGDNRGSSDDSRFWGPVPSDWVIGKAVASYWPPGRLGGL